MTWYTGTYGSNGHGLTIHDSFMVKCVCYMGLWIHWFHDHGATILSGSVTIGRTSLVGVGHSRSEIVPLMLCTICYAMAKVQALYYKSLRTAPTLLRRVISRVDHTVKHDYYLNYTHILSIKYISHIVQVVMMELLLLIKHPSSLLNWHVIVQI